MKTNELMIGDWVLINKQPVQLTMQDLVYVHQGRECEPIPLTPEILEKNGWTYNQKNGNYEYRFGAYCIYINMAEKVRIYVCNDYVFGMALLYVHELQHAFRLCGLYELADNFKIE